jgi:hypothetical protein
VLAPTAASGGGRRTPPGDRCPVRSGPVRSGLVTVDGDRVVAGWGGQWRMPSPAGGTEPARQAEESTGSRATVADATAEATPPDP